MIPSQEARNKSFQKYPELEEIKTVRDNFNVELRKTKRKTLIQKKRASSPLNKSLQINSSNTLEPSEASLASILIQVRSCNDIATLEALLHSFKYLSSKFPNSSFSDYFDGALIQQFFHILTCNMVSVQSMALWVLINEFHNSGASISRFVSGGVLEVLDSVLKQVTCPDIVENTLWVLGNIVSENIEYRNTVSALGILDRVIELSGDSDPSIQRTAYWVLFSITCYKPAPAYYISRKILDTVGVGLRSEDSETIEHCAWIAFYLSAAYDQLLQIILNSEVIGVVQGLLKRTEVEVLKPLLKTVGNAASGTDSQTKVIVQMGFLSNLLFLSGHPVVQVRGEVLFIVSNILASTEELALAVYRSPLLRKILDCIQDPNLYLKKSALLCICNSTYLKSLKVLKVFLNHQVIAPLLQVLLTQEEFLKIESLKALRNLLSLSKSQQPFEDHEKMIGEIYELGGYDSLQDLKTHSNPKITSEAFYVLNTFFDVPNSDSLRPVEVFSIN